MLEVSYFGAKDWQNEEKPNNTEVFIIQFTESVANFDEADLKLFGTSSRSAAIAEVAATDQSDTIFEITVTNIEAAKPTGEGQLHLGLDASQDITSRETGQNLDEMGIVSDADIPAIELDYRKYWLNVEDFGAIANDGIDDTAAIQAAIDFAQSNPSEHGAVYFPKGQFEISETLEIGGLDFGYGESLELVGHGRSTTIAWHGEVGGDMVHVKGSQGSQYHGITWDGRNLADHAFYHNPERFETRIRHEFEKMENFRVGGIGGENTEGFATAEVVITNCLFNNIGMEGDGGIAAIYAMGFNNYTWNISNVEVYDSIRGYYGSPVPQMRIVSSHFENSAVADIETQGSGGLIRNISSLDSSAFLKTGSAPAGNPSDNFVIDVFVEDWKQAAFDLDPNGISGHFTDIYIADQDQEGSGSESFAFLHGDSPHVSNVIFSETITKQYTSTNTDNVDTILNIPSQATQVTTVSSGSQRFLNNQIEHAGHQYFVSDYLELGLSDSQALQFAIDAAKGAGEGAIAIIDRDLIIDMPVIISGADYSLEQKINVEIVSSQEIGGEGAIQVVDPDNITIKNLFLDARGDVGVSVEGASTLTASHLNIIQSRVTGTGDDFTGWRFAGLDHDDTILVDRLEGNVVIDESADSIFLAEMIVSGGNDASFSVAGGGGEVGFVGIDWLQVDNHQFDHFGINVLNNKNLVVGAYYGENIYDHVFLSGSESEDSGRITINSIRTKSRVEGGDLVLSDGYSGEFVLLNLNDKVGPTSIVLLGEAELDIAISNVGAHQDNSGNDFFPIELSNSLSDVYITNGELETIDLDLARKSQELLDLLSNGLSDLRDLNANLQIFSEGRSSAEIVADQSFSVVEDFTADEILFHVDFSSDTYDGLANWRFTSGNEGNIFEIDPSSGAVRVGSSAGLQGLSGSEIILGVCAVDALFGEVEGSILIRVNPVTISHLLDLSQMEEFAFLSIADNKCGGSAAGTNLFGVLDVIGTNFSDVLIGSDEANSFLGSGGDDFVAGGDGTDTIRGGSGNDTLRGGDGSDRMYGGSGEDFLTGGSNDDRLFGRKGSDEIFGGRGKDTIFGNSAGDVLHGNRGDDVLHGNRGADLVKGGRGDDKLFGGANCDFLIGGGGDDVLHGGNGRDVLVGGGGYNTLAGGLGVDRFVFDNTVQRDVIVDFEFGVDLIDLRGTSVSRSSSDLVQFDDGIDRVLVWSDSKGEHELIFRGAAGVTVGPDSLLV